MSKSQNRRSRAYIRHQKFRIRKKCKEIARKWLLPWGNHEETVERVAKLAKKLEKTRPECSNPGCCGNPRHLKGQNEQTMQEKRAEIEENEQKSELLGNKSLETTYDEWVNHVKKEQYEAMIRGLND